VDWEDGIDFHNNNPAQNSVRIKVRRRAAADSLPLRIRVNSKITGLTQAETSCRYKFFWTTDLFSGLKVVGATDFNCNNQFLAV
jgi:hypothetical protein